MGYFIAFVVVLITGSALFLAYKGYERRKAPGEDNRRQLDAALLRLSREIQRNPNSAAAFSRRGTRRQKKGDLAGALADLDRATALDPSLAEARFYRALALKRKGDVAGAEKEFNWIMRSSEDPFYKTAVKERLAQARARKKPG